MAFLSWTENGHLHWEALLQDTVIGRDPVLCGVSNPQAASVSKRHASLQNLAGNWLLRDLKSSNGTILNGLPIPEPMGACLMDGDMLSLGEWNLLFSSRFPGLDGQQYAENVGAPAREIDPAMNPSGPLVRALEALHLSTSALLREQDPIGMARELLEMALRLLQGDRGFVVMRSENGGWQVAHRVGNVWEGLGLSRSVLDYVNTHAVSVLSNAPMSDPRFQGHSLAEMHRGALICAPILESERTVAGVLYLDRESSAQAFSRFDLSMLQAFVQQASLGLRQAGLARKALSHAELLSEVTRQKVLQEHRLAQHQEQLSSLSQQLRWFKAWSMAHPEEITFQLALDRMVRLLQGIEEEELAGACPRRNLSPLDIQLHLQDRWESLLNQLNARLQWSEHPTEDFSILIDDQTLLALESLVEPLLLQLRPQDEVLLRWLQLPDGCGLSMLFPEGCHGPVTDLWSEHQLLKNAIRWSWQENRRLEIDFPMGVHRASAENQPKLALVGDSMDLMGLFLSVADAGGLDILPLTPDPPAAAPQPIHFLIIDASGVQDVVKTIQTYRAHPNFIATPILAVRIPEELIQEVMSCGATDWLPVHFQWEQMHHRLQVLRSHQELQEKARAFERLESVKKMAGALKHEINNPLAIMSMQVEMLQMKYPDEARLEKMAEMIDRIKVLLLTLNQIREQPTGDENFAKGLL